MPKLIVNAGTPQAREYDLKPGANYVGRGFANDIQLDDASVSGSHAQIILTGNVVTVKDLGSTNGTFINRAPVTEAALQPGQYVRLGGVELLLQADGQTELLGKTSRAQAPVSAPIIGEFRIVGTPMIAGRSAERVDAQPAPVAMPAISEPATATPAAASPIKGLKLTEPASSSAPSPAPVAAATPAAPARIVVATPVAVKASPATIAVEPPPAAKPPVAPPIPTGMVEPPAGKTACKYHPNNPGHWLCQTCGGLFCSLCVASRRTDEGTGYFCRGCATQCVPVKVKFVPKKEKGPKHYSDVAVLIRSISFGCIGAVVAAAIWMAVAGIVGAVVSFMPGILCWVTGILCGFGVKIGSQDRPGIIFSLIAVGAMFLGIGLGEAAMAMTGHMIFIGMYGVIGLLAGGFSAWRFGGGDF